MTKPKKLDKISPKSKVWLELNGSLIFGGGRATLFEAIDETGSIRQAANKLGMSYRAAWGKIKTTEERIGFQLLEKHAGGHQSGAKLTPYAKKLLECYKGFEEEANLTLKKLFKHYFHELFSEQIKI